MRKLMVLMLFATGCNLAQEDSTPEDQRVRAFDRLGAPVLLSGDELKVLTDVCQSFQNKKTTFKFKFGRPGSSQTLTSQGNFKACGAEAKEVSSKLSLVASGSSYQWQLSSGDSEFFQSFETDTEGLLEPLCSKLSESNLLNQVEISSSEVHQFSLKPKADSRLRSVQVKRFLNVQNTFRNIETEELTVLVKDTSGAGLTGLVQARSLETACEFSNPQAGRSFLSLIIN